MEFDPIPEYLKVFGDRLRAAVYYRRQRAGTLLITPEGFELRGGTKEVEKIFSQVKEEGFLVLAPAPWGDGGCIIRERRYPLCSYTFELFQEALRYLFPHLSVELVEVIQ